MATVREILHTPLHALLSVTALALASCSTTGRLTADQTLYTGVGTMRIESAATGEGGKKPEKVPGSVRAAVRAPLSVKPNNPLISPWVRTPLPVGLWAYNSFYTEKERGLRAWLYRTLAKQPVILEHDVQPAARTGMVRDILDNHGYFGSTADFEIFPRNNPKKARVGYTVSVAPAWFYSAVRFPLIDDSLPVTREIASLALTSNVRPSAQYNVDTLVREQARITTGLREKGYWWFRPEYLEYRADTTLTPYGVNLHMDLARSAPAAALVPYKVGEVSLRLFGSTGVGEADSMEVAGTRVWYQKPLELRPSVIRRAMSLRTGQTASLSAINRMLDNLTRLGVFRYVNLETPPLDSLPPFGPLDLTISAAMDTPVELTGEADLAYLSSSFMGPTIALSLGHGNIFHGGERLSFNFKGSYEWQTGNTSTEAGSTAVNSYELGIGASLVFPRMIVPRFIDRALSYGGKTSYSLGVDLLNRPKFFQMLSFNFSNSYDFRTSSTVTHSLTPLRMVYNKMLRTTAAFDEAMAGNEAIARSFRDQFIPSASYTFAYDKRFGHLRGDRLTVQATLMSAGNVWAGAYALTGAPRGEGAKRLFGDPFSQFFKETAELRFYKQVARAGTFALRLFAGAGHAYGNSLVLPYTEQFYIGGANSIRAFTIRSIGPGSFRPRMADGYTYFDQTGEMKLEMNAEFRFHVAGGLNGAVFLDAGNIWLLRDDPERPGARIGDSGFFDSVATGTGVGVRYDLSFLVVRLDLGIGLHLPYETSRSGYYNIPRFRDGMGLHLAIGYPF